MTGLRKKRKRISKLDLIRKRYGQRVTVPIQERDNRGKRIPYRYTTVTGILEYAGPNEYLDIPLQVTIGRMPVSIKSLEDIKHEEFA